MTQAGAPAPPPPPCCTRYVLVNNLLPLQVARIAGAGGEAVGLGMIAMLIQVSGFTQPLLGAWCRIPATAPRAGSPPSPTHTHTPWTLPLPTPCTSVHRYTPGVLTGPRLGGFSGLTVGMSTALQVGQPGLPLRPAAAVHRGWAAAGAAQPLARLSSLC